jgi:CO/xanthine dehydrogenase FAD-binding subunit
MKTFEFSQPADPSVAIAAAAGAKTAQQGADVRFLAGGTTLIDLMKLNVETPARVVDINRLPLDKIEATPEGGLKIGATSKLGVGVSPDGSARLCRPLTGPPGRRLGTDSKYGDNGW